MNRLAKVLFVFILAVIALLALGLMVTRASAQEEPPAPAVYLPMVGNKTSKGPYRVTGVLYLYGDTTYNCVLIRLGELWYYDPATGTGIFVLDDAFCAGDITGDPKKGEVPGWFKLDEVLDENGVPIEVLTKDHILIIGKPGDCLECYDVIEWPLVFGLYPGQTQHIERVYARQLIREYCWPDPDEYGKAWTFETVDGEFVITGSIDIAEVDHAAE